MMFSEAPSRDCETKACKAAGELIWLPSSLVAAIKARMMARLFSVTPVNPSACRSCTVTVGAGVTPAATSSSSLKALTMA